MKAWALVRSGTGRLRGSAEEHSWCGTRLLLASICILWGGTPLWAILGPTQLMILVNKDVSISSQIAQMYRKAREIPAANILSLSLGTEKQITPEQYWAKAGPQVKKFLEANPQIHCILTTSGVPYTIQATDGKDDGAAFDSELAVILREQPGDRKRGSAESILSRRRKWLRGQRSAKTADGIRSSPGRSRSEDNYADG